MDAFKTVQSPILMFLFMQDYFITVQDWYLVIETSGQCFSFKITAPYCLQYLHAFRDILVSNLWCSSTTSGKRVQLLNKKR